MQEIPDFPVTPIYNGIYKALRRQLAGGKQRIQTFLVISDMYFLIAVGNLLFKDAPALGTADAFCPANTCGKEAPLAVLFLEDGAAIPGHAGRRH
jgi:hypothetical protein